MPDILHEFPVFAPPDKVWEACGTPAGLDAWWTLRASGEARVGSIWTMFFGDGYDWRGLVSRAEYGREIAWTMRQCDADWNGTSVAISLSPIERGTLVRFSHTGWPEASAHYRVSSFCWAMYLRLMKKWCETGEVVEYARRLES